MAPALALPAPQQSQQLAPPPSRLPLASPAAEFTPGWRAAGLPVKPSALRLDQQRLAAAGLLDPLELRQRQSSHVQQEVLLPPRVFEYNDTSQAPHYLQSTANLRVGAPLRRHGWSCP